MSRKSDASQIDNPANMYFFKPGSTLEITYAPMYLMNDRKYNSDVFKTILGLRSSPNLEEHSYVSRATFIPFDKRDLSVYNAINTSVILIRPAYDEVRFQELKPDTTLKDVFVKTGGLVSAIGAVVVFLIGTSHLSPWGVLAEIPYFRRRLAKDLDCPDPSNENRHDSGNEIRGPFQAFRKKNDDQEKEVIGKFTSAVKRMSTEGQLLYLKKRIDLLEIVLSDYYLDTEVFEDAESESTSHNSQEQPDEGVGGIGDRPSSTDVTPAEVNIPIPHDNEDPQVVKEIRRRSLQTRQGGAEQASRNMESPSAV
ncbi:hypothetical protein BG006_001309 [Podila minutissima]|uniref:Uncharacterized protein n=1 Tax=Podila minutissima TaxID=64525 RepID=A0A9P5VHB0_9FUNG|nr:hypothetical protein BG006_001309 [Podila minutissima]